MTPHVSFVIPVRNDVSRLRRCLTAIASNRSDLSTAEVIVADNGSTDGSAETARALGARVLPLPGLRVSQLRNYAAAAARGRILAFVDADNEIGPAWVGAALDVLKDSRVAAVGAIYTAPQSGPWVQRAYGALRGRTIGRSVVRWLASGNLAIRRAAFEAIGGFDSTLDSCEDVDVCERLQEAGWVVVADERLHSVHLGDPLTLGGVFHAERWRGRDNLRVSLRRPSLRDTPSIAIPLIDLAACGGVVGGVVAAPLLGPAAVAVALTATGAAVSLSALRVIRAQSRGDVSGIVRLSQCLAVALVYDLARAAALVTRASHHRHADNRVALNQATT